MARTITVDTEVEVDLSDFSDDVLLEEVRERSLSAGYPPAGMNVLQRIVWEHDILGLPLSDVVDQLMHESGVIRQSATAAFQEA